MQIGDGQALARRLALPVAYDFRAADVAAGGQGAPLVPVFHQSLARDLARPHPIAVLNLGGVANVTFVDGGDPIACDTGPGNALIDDFMRARTGRALRQLRRRRGNRQTGPQSSSPTVLDNPFFDLNAAEIARPQCIRLRQYRSAEFFRARWRRNAVGADRRSGGRILPHLPALPGPGSSPAAARATAR